ncbi:hypothetical protein BDK51DRAFT_39309 [Blyttiomyces helicus]|uniref:Uncharacterized protein n=1 Tax=Blyttiomyces helicus TaxID=388810 RepID=A0A4P9VX87_9FUNG|nr:hypothetical protein BDK51DRAFT_39309 [Blyttiomyces helicus]|eukprot:RKO83852.1 hypothetical protein BDK51DRAFT_39309 [Blyttiomyces helicus]
MILRSHQLRLPLVACLAASLADARQLAWNIQPLQASSHNLGVGPLVPATALVPYSTYHMKISLVFKDDGTQCTYCAQEFSNLGGLPVVTAGMNSAARPEETFASDWAGNSTPVQTAWYLPLTTRAPEIVSLQVTTNGVVTPMILKGRLDAASFSFSVSWFAGVLVRLF